MTTAATKSKASIGGGRQDRAALRKSALTPSVGCRHQIGALPGSIFGIDLYTESITLAGIGRTIRSRGPIVTLLVKPRSRAGDLSERLAMRHAQPVRIALG